MPSMLGRRPAPNSEHVNRREKSNQHYGVKHEKQGVAGGEVQCRQNQDDEGASEDGVCIVPVVTTVHELKNETAQHEHEHANDAWHHVTILSIRKQQAQGEIGKD